MGIIGRGRAFQAIRLVLALLLVIAGSSLACIPQGAREEAARFQVVALEVSPAEVLCGQKAAVTARVTNTGNVRGDYKAELYIDGVVVESKVVPIAPQATEAISFSVSRDMVGSYSIGLGGLRQTLAVKSCRGNYRLSNTRLYEIKFTSKVINKGTRVASNVESFLALPQDTLSQKIIRFETKPEPAAYLFDSWGNRVAHYRFDRLAPNAEAEATWTVTVELSDIRYDIDPTKVGTLADIPEEIRLRYTTDGKYYRLTSSVVQAAARDAVGNETNLYYRVKRIHDYVLQHLRYKEEFWDRFDWDAADRTLIERSGVCSEYAFVFIALCRLNGVPARFYTGSWRDGQGHFVDERFHRTVEVFLPNYGWIPVDPTLDDLSVDKYAYFAAAKNDVLTLIVAGGESEYLGWYYHTSHELGSGVRPSDMQVYRSAEWTPK